MAIYKTTYCRSR